MECRLQYRQGERITLENIYSVVRCNENITIYKHISGLEIIYFKNSDKNRVFSLCVKTVAKNNRGIPHVLEHMILAGSKKYPIRDPFNELEKSCIFSYLNAITYGDRTIYPIASKNQLSFDNMFKVYVDGIFSPLLKEEVFIEEGLGIVFNEMKSMYDDVETKIEECIYEELFKDSFMSFDTGGKPEDIANLTLNEVIEYYKKYYNPHNMICYFYGDINIDYYLNYMHNEYLKDFEGTDFKVQYPIERKNKKVFVSKEIIGDFKYIYSIHFVFQGEKNYYNISLLIIAIEYLLSTDTSPLKDFLWKRYDLENITCDIDTDNYLPTFYIRMRSEDKKDINLIYKEMVSFLSNHIKRIDEERIVSIYNNYLFAIQEEDYGYKPKGLGYNLELLEKWLYTEDRSEINLYSKFSTENIFEDIIDIIKNEILKNDYFAIGEFTGINQNQVIEDERVPSVIECNYKEAMKLPLTPKSDLLLTKPKQWDEYKLDFGRVLHYKSENKRISYALLMYKLDHISYINIGLFMDLFGRLPLKSKKISELESELSKYTNDYNISVEMLNDHSFCLIIELKAFSYNIYRALELMNDIIFNTDFSDISYIRKKIKEIINNKTDVVYCNNKQLVVNKALSNLYNSYKFEDMINGFDYLRYLKEITDEDIKNLNNMKSHIVLDDFVLSINLHENYLQLTKIDNVFHEITKNSSDLHNKLLNSNPKVYNYNDKELFIDNPITLNTNVLAIKFNEDIYCGASLVLASIIKNEILNEKIRLKNGAYGYDVFVSYQKYIYFISTEDREIEETYDVFANMEKYLDEITFDEDMVHKHIISTVNHFNFHKNSYDEFLSNFLMYLNHIDLDNILKLENEIINLNKEKLINYYKYLFSIKKEQIFLSFGKKMSLFKKNWG